MADGAPDREAELLAALIRERYGDRLSPEQLEDLRRALERQLAEARALRAVRLTNADEPAPSFVPWRADE